MSLNNDLYYCVFDLETTGLNVKACQITQVAAIMINAKKLTFDPLNDVFNTEVMPEFDDAKAIKAGFDPVAQAALDKTRKTREQLEKAPGPKVAWKRFADFVSKYNQKGAYYAPVPVGFNINSFDLPIVYRYCELFGPCEAKTKAQKLFNKYHKVDVRDMLYTWFENEDSVKKTSLDYWREYFGFSQESKDNAHDALFDVIDTANIFIRFLKHQRFHSSATKFEKSFEKWDMPIKYENIRC